MRNEITKEICRERNISDFDFALLKFYEFKVLSEESNRRIDDSLCFANEFFPNIIFRYKTYWSYLGVSYKSIADILYVRIFQLYSESLKDFLKAEDGLKRAEANLECIKQQRNQLDIMVHRYLDEK